MNPKEEAIQLILNWFERASDEFASMRASKEIKLTLTNNRKVTLRERDLENFKLGMDYAIGILSQQPGEFPEDIYDIH